MSSSLITRVPAAGRIGAALGVALLAATACSSAASTTASSAPAATAPVSTAPASTAPAGPGTASAGTASGTVITTRSGSDGTFLTDGTGRALYLWAADSKGKSACSGACAGAWPPVPAAGTVTASGRAIAGDLSTITRSDGSKQVAYDGHPLYYFVGDTGAGQTNGQGSDGFGAKWWLVTPSGTAITGSGTAATPAGNGY